MGQVRIATSGWHYASWWGPFFPENIRKKDALIYYASQFSATELNAPFYRTPTVEAVRGWVEQTPDDFLFAWKASKFITHWKRLSERCENSIALPESRLKILGRKAGPVLFQLPPQFEVNRERLASFLKMLPKRRRYVFEFRHPSWYGDAILDLLRERDVALCISDHHHATGSLGGHGAPRLFAAARSRWPLPGQLQRRCVAPLGARHPPLAARGPRRVLLLRQRPERARRRAMRGGWPNSWGGAQAPPRRDVASID